MGQPEHISTILDRVMEDIEPQAGYELTGEQIQNVLDSMTVLVVYIAAKKNIDLWDSFALGIHGLMETGKAIVAATEDTQEQWH
jgi:hypothetical protein